MLQYITLFNKVADIISWFREIMLKRSIRKEIEEEIKDETEQWIQDVIAVRESVALNTPYTSKLLNEIAKSPIADSGDDILSSLRTSLHNARRAESNKAWHLKELRNLEGNVYRYSENSLGNLQTCHGELQLIVLEMSRKWDCTVVCGTRTLAEQQEAYDNGASKLKPGESKHNRYPSDAIDIVPYIATKAWAKGKDLTPKIYKEFANDFFAVAEKYNIKIRWGGDWDMDGDSSDQSFMDFAHYERV